jgi:hypothetical protein
MKFSSSLISSKSTSGKPIQSLKDCSNSWCESNYLQLDSNVSLDTRSAPSLRSVNRRFNLSSLELHTVRSCNRKIQPCTHSTS